MMRIEDWRKFFRENRLKFLKRLEKELPDGLVCFDCGQKLTPANACFFMDWGGVLVWCSDCSGRTLSIKEMWRKILGARPKHR